VSTLDPPKWPTPTRSRPVHSPTLRPEAPARDLRELGGASYEADLYAEAGIREYWILNVLDGALEVYRDPAGDHYASVTSYPKDASVSMLAFPDVTIPVNSLFI
jgi:hypothetical protein